MTSSVIQVLVVDDSSTERMRLQEILEEDERLRVVGTVADGKAATDFIQRSRPDVVLMDICMPGLDGYEVSRLIMERMPVPIVICSSKENIEQMTTAVRVLEAGAVACVAKPPGREHAEYEPSTIALRRTVRLMSEVRVVRRRSAAHGAFVRHPVIDADATRAQRIVEVIGIGGSTGAPPILRMILADLPRNFPVPILVVQHMLQGFVSGMASWLTQTTGVPVIVAKHGMFPEAGHVYVAPDGFHMGLRKEGRIALSQDAPLHGLRPSVSYLFRSLAEARGPSAVGVLLTGMGRDGAAELRLMRERGAFTIAQDRQSSIVHGMSGEAIELGGASSVLPADRIAAVLAMLAARP